MSDANELAAMRQELDALKAEVTRLNDVNAVRKLQYTYGYFIDKSQYNECVDLFADDGEVWFLGGI